MIISIQSWIIISQMIIDVDITTTDTVNKYPLVMTNSLRTGKSPCYSWENSLEMAMFHSCVSLPEGNWKDCFFPESPLVLDDFRHADTQTQILLLNPTAPEISRKKPDVSHHFPSLSL